MQRRKLLKLGVGGAIVLALGGGGLALMQPGLKNGRMTDGAKSVFRAVGAAILAGRLPADVPGRDAALEAHLKRLDDTFMGLPAATQSELSQMLALLSSPPGRWTLAGLRADWSVADESEVQAALQSMRLSTLGMRQQIYHALRELTNAAFHAGEETWPLMGYPGPRTI
jgi:hypothetical protein